MNIELKGPEAIVKRMDDLVAQMSSKLGSAGTTGKATNAPPAFASVMDRMTNHGPTAVLSGAILGNETPGGLSPMRPGGLGITPSDGGNVITEMINRIAGEEGVDPALVRAIVSAESNYNPDAVSPVGAQGLMQLMPDTSRMLGVTNPFDPEQNIRGGTKYIRQLLSQFGGNVEKAVAAYNAGPGNVTRYNGIPPFGETQNYVRRVLGNMNSPAGGIGGR